MRKCQHTVGSVFIKLLKMYLVTGGQDGSTFLDSTEIYDPVLENWKAGAALSGPKKSLRAANIDNRVLFFGINILLLIDKTRRSIFGSDSMTPNK